MFKYLKARHERKQKEEELKQLKETEDYIERIKKQIEEDKKNDKFKRHCKTLITSAERLTNY